MYHLYNKVATESKLFKEEADYHKFLALFHRYFQNYFDYLAYALIPNHFHFVVRVKPITEEVLVAEKTVRARQLLAGDATVDMLLTHQAARWFSSYMKGFNHRHRRTGPMLKQGFRRVAQGTMSHILDKIAYNHHNAIHHGLVKEYHQHPFSSYNAFTQNKKTLMAKEEVLDWYGGLEGFLNYHQVYKDTFFR